MSTFPGVIEIPQGRLLYRGAEADVIRGEWQGLDAVYKVRKPLTYRLPVLDETIRHQRTVREAEMIHSAKKAGVPSPFLYCVDIPSSTLVMEFVEGERVKDLVAASSRKETADIFFEFGQGAARLHASGMMHGDLTTANVVRRKRNLVFIDFGLSIKTTRLEDHAVDLRLIKETLVGAHPEVATAAMDALIRGYTSVAGPSRSQVVQRQLQSIERRGRYARVT
jgi:TP53 regulating kinase and related kinases